MNTQRASAILAILALHLTVNRASAQVKPDTLPLMKNEIGVNVIPFALMLNNSSDNGHAPLVHVLYKRQLKPNLYGRLSLSVNSGNPDNYVNTASVIRTNSNTSASLESTSYKGRDYLQYMAGLEWRWGRKNVRQFAGMDLSYANYKSETQTTERPIISANNNWNDSTIAHYKHTSNAIGMNPFYGLIFNFSKHFFISAQVGLNLQFTARNSKKIIDNRNLPYAANGPITNFDLNTTGVSNHIAICYRF